MKRDLDLVRKVLMACESSPHGIAPNPLKIDGYDDEQIGFHVYLMMQAGLLEGTETSHYGSKSPTAVASNPTWAGFEFLEASRDDGRWKTAKGVANKAGAMTLEALKSVLSELATSAIKSAIGLP